MNIHEKNPLIFEGPETVVSGSFRKHMEQIRQVMSNFEKAGVKVLAPTSPEVVDPNQEFIILATDDAEKAPNELEKDFMREIRRAAFLYVANVDGYIGKSAATEMAYARLKNIPVLTAEPISKFASEIPSESYEILRQITMGTLAIKNITSEAVEKLKIDLASYKSSEIVPEEVKILNDLIKDLLKDLNKSNEK